MTVWIDDARTEYTITDVNLSWTSGLEPATYSVECPKCENRIVDKRDHATGCPHWGMLPEHWRER